MMLRHSPNDESGFTLVELLVVMVLSVAFSGLVLSFFIDFWRSSASLQDSSDTFVTRQDAGDRLRDSLNVASNLINQNSIADSHTLNADPGDVSGTHWLILHAIPGNIAMPATGTKPVFYFDAPSIDSSKNFIMNGVQPYTDEFVLYLDASTKQLLMRTLANPAATGNRLVTTCPPSLASASCPADKLIATDIASVDTRYFSRSGNPIDYTSIVDPLTSAYIGPDYSVAEVVELTLNLYRKSTVHGGQDTINQTVVRVALRNG